MSEKSGWHEEMQSAWLYRVSKAALNMVVRCLQMAQPDITVPPRPYDGRVDRRPIRNHRRGLPWPVAVVAAMVSTLCVLTLGTPGIVVVETIVPYPVPPEFVAYALR